VVLSSSGTWISGQISYGGCRVIKVKVPELMRKKSMNTTELMRKANIAYPTALRLSKGEGNAITFDVLESLCKLFEVQVKDVLEYVPDK
jgi:putative transcriptional regulator